MSAEVWIPCERVEVAEPFKKIEPVPTFSCPWTLRLPAKVEVPVPFTERRPVLSTLKSVVVALAVDEAMAKRVVFVPPLLAWRESFANGDVVLIPTFPVVLTVSADVRPESVESRKLLSAVRNATSLVKVPLMRILLG